MNTKGKTNGKSAKSNGHSADAGAAHADPPRHGIPVPPEKRCGYKTQKGTPCRAARRNGSQHCIFHDEDFQERRIGLKVGAHFLTLRDTPDSAEGIHEILRRNVEAVANNKISPRVANSISYAVQLMIANLPSLEQARSNFNIKEDSAQKMAHILVSTELDKIEKEIQEAGNHAFPIRAARAPRPSLAATAPPSPEAPASGIALRPGPDNGAGKPTGTSKANGSASAVPADPVSVIPPQPHPSNGAEYEPPPPWAAEPEEIASGRRPYQEPPPDDGRMNATEEPRRK